LISGSYFGPNPIWVSTNSGGTWWTVSINDSPYATWSSFAVSADGSKLVAATTMRTGEPAGRIYTSADLGATWITNLTLTLAVTDYFHAHFPSVASSADGTKLVAAVPYGTIYTSTNSGTTWISNNVPNANWSCVVSSADGNKLVATVNGGGIYILQTTPAPQLNITPTNGNFTLSWIVPSTSFVLQQGSDLSGWTDLTDTPVLNLTNLHNEVILSPTGYSGFYRLKTP
jgi:photosystem II stability/assembly factor-like uncharacterized protein